MDFPIDVLSPPSQADRKQFVERIEQAQQALVTGDPIMALNYLANPDHGVTGYVLFDRMVESIVREARQSGATWQDIAIATGVEDRQAAQRRWTDREKRRRKIIKDLEEHGVTPEGAGVDYRQAAWRRWADQGIR